jgi:hypothetical protein
MFSARAGFPLVLHRRDASRRLDETIVRGEDQVSAVRQVADLEDLEDPINVFFGEHIVGRVLVLLVFLGRRSLAAKEVQHGGRSAPYLLFLEDQAGRSLSQISMFNLCLPLGTERYPENDGWASLGGGVECEVELKLGAKWCRLKDEDVNLVTAPEPHLQSIRNAHSPYWSLHPRLEPAATASMATCGAPEPTT